MAKILTDFPENSLVVEVNSDTYALFGPDTIKNYIRMRALKWSGGVPYKVPTGLYYLTLGRRGRRLEMRLHPLETE